MTPRRHVVIVAYHARRSSSMAASSDSAHGSEPRSSTTRARRTSGPLSSVDGAALHRPRARTSGSRPASNLALRPCSTGHPRMSCFLTRRGTSAPINGHCQRFLHRPGNGRVAAVAPRLRSLRTDGAAGRLAVSISGDASGRRLSASVPCPERLRHRCGTAPSVGGASGRWPLRRAVLPLRRGDRLAAASARLGWSSAVCDASPAHRCRDERRDRRESAVPRRTRDLHPQVVRVPGMARLPDWRPASAPLFGRPASERATCRGSAARALYSPARAAAPG